MQYVNAACHDLIDFDCKDNDKYRMLQINYKLFCLKSFNLRQTGADKERFIPINGGCAQYGQTGYSLFIPFKRDAQSGRVHGESASSSALRCVEFTARPDSG